MQLHQVADGRGAGELGLDEGQAAQGEPAQPDRVFEEAEAALGQRRAAAVDVAALPGGDVVGHLVAGVVVPARRGRAGRAAGRAYQAKARAGQAPPGRVPEEAAVTVAEIALEQATAAQQARCDAYDQRVAASAGRGVPGARPAPPEQAAAVRRARERLAAARKAAKARAVAPPGGQDPPGAAGRGKRNKKPPKPVRNITDPDSRAMHCTRNGTVQAYNCQVPRCDDGLILAARATQDVNDAAQVEPTLAGITAAQQAIAAGHQAGTPGLVPHRHRRLRRRVLQREELRGRGPGPADQPRLLGIGRKQRPAHPRLPAPRPPRPDGPQHLHPAGPRHLPPPRAAVRGRLQLPQRQDRAAPVLHARPAPRPGRAHPRRDRQQPDAAAPTAPQPSQTRNPAGVIHSTTRHLASRHARNTISRHAGPAPQAREHQQPAIPSLARPSKARNPRPAPGAAAHRPRPRESSATRPRAW